MAVTGRAEKPARFKSNATLFFYLFECVCEGSLFLPGEWDVIPMKRITKRSFSVTSSN